MELKKLIYILLLIPFNLFATDYYVKNGGSDAAAGTSDATAWATISKVNSVAFSAGDRVYFKRGSIWREETALNPRSGSAGTYITYGAYGTGAKPKLLGSVQLNNSSDWTVYSGNVWQNSDDSFTVNVGNLIFNNEYSWGDYKTTLAGVVAQGDFFFNTSTNVLYLYSMSNPATYYTNIEAALDREIIVPNGGEDYLIFENLDCRYSGGHGLSAATGCSYITIRDCDFSYIGGGSFEGGAARYGNAIQFWQSSSNITIERCTFDNILDAAISPQYSGSGTCNIDNWIVRYNIINRSEYSFEYFTSTTVTGTVNNIFFQNNTCLNAGLGFGDGQRPDGENGRHIIVWVCSIPCTNFYVRNNIFSVADESAIYIATTAEDDVTFDYNLYNVTTLAYNGTTYNTLAQWVAHRSDENNSISGDPDFNSDYSLQVTSPAIDEGVNTGYTTDYLLNTVPHNTYYDMGALEYIEVATIASVTTDAITDIEATTATSGGNVTSDGGSTVTARGVCWNTATGPTIANSKTTDGSGTGLFTSSITGLTGGLTYYVRAYATNTIGTAYGNERTFVAGSGEIATGSLLKHSSKLIKVGTELIKIE